MKDAPDETAVVERWLNRLSRAGPAELDAVRGELLRHAGRRLERLARRMLRDFPRLRRWEETGDVLQNASWRLHQALSQVRPRSAREFFALAATQMRRELIDLSRHHFGPEGAAAHHHTSGVASGDAEPLTASAASGDYAGLAAWSEFHEQVARLPDKEREVVQLVWYEGLKQSAAAALLGVTERTVKNRWRNARRFLAERLPQGDWGFDDDGDVARSAPAACCRLPELLAGRYRPEALLAEGGFSQVWRATDVELNRAVAVKVTTVDCLAEARRVARLEHHGIVRVRDSGQEVGHCFIVFDLVAGGDLARRLKNGPLPWPQAADIIAQAAERLDFAHQRGFVHRDVKPGNILLDESGKVVLADFGIAVTREELARETATSLGTLAYMSPEQLTMPGRVDARTD